jgi:hypothetical protein
MKQTALGATAILISVACGESLSPDEIPDIDGVWTVTESIESITNSCRFLGTVDIHQDGEHFSGQFSRTSQCSYGDIPGAAATGSASIAIGRVGRETVDYRIGDCDYRGVLASGERPRQMTGSLICTTIHGSGQLSSASGIWQADRVSD